MWPAPNLGGLNMKFSQLNKDIKKLMPISQQVKSFINHMNGCMVDSVFSSYFCAPNGTFTVRNKKNGNWVIVSAEPTEGVAEIEIPGKKIPVYEIHDLKHLIAYAFCLLEEEGYCLSASGELFDLMAIYSKKKKAIIEQHLKCFANYAAKHEFCSALYMHTIYLDNLGTGAALEASVYYSEYNDMYMTCITIFEGAKYFSAYKTLGDFFDAVESKACEEVMRKIIS